MNKTRKKIPRCQLHWYRLKATKLPPCWTFTYIKTDIILPIHMQILRLSQVVFHTSGTVGWKLHVQVTTTWQAGKTFECPILLRTCLLPTRINWILQHALAIDRSALTNFLIEYSVFTVITPWQYISLPEYAPMFGFPIRHVESCIEYVNLNIWWLAASRDNRRQQNHYSFVSTNGRLPKTSVKIINKYLLPLLTVYEYNTNQSLIFHLHTPIIGLGDFLIKMRLCLHLISLQ